MYLLAIDSHSTCTSVGQCTSARTQEVRILHLCWTVDHLRVGWGRPGRYMLNSRRHLKFIEFQLQGEVL